MMYANRQETPIIDLISYRSKLDIDEDKAWVSAYLG